MLKDEGVAVHRIRYSETSWIVTWVTCQYGVIKTLFKGGTTSQKFKIDLFYECHLAYRRSRSSHLHYLSEIELIDPHPHIHQSYLKVLCMNYFFEIIAKLVEVDTPVPEYYDIFHKALIYLRDHEVDETLLERYERRIIKNMGWEGASRELLWEHAGVPKSYALLQRELGLLFKKTPY